MTEVISSILSAAFFIEASRSEIDLWPATGHPTVLNSMLGFRMVRKIFCVPPYNNWRNPMRHLDKPMKSLENNKVLNKQFIWISIKRTVGCFLYSLIFLGLQIKTLTIICLFLTFPFLPIAYIVGSVTAGVVGNSAIGYELGACSIIFVQSYLVLSLLSKFIPKTRRKK